MEKSLIFIHKPTILIFHDEISTVSCERLTESSQRFFEMAIHTKKGEIYEFNNIERREYSSICSYFDDKKIKFTTDEENTEDNKVITSKKIRQAPKNMDIDLPSEEELDEEYDEDDEDDEDFDASLEENKMKKRKGKDEDMDD